MVIGSYDAQIVRARDKALLTQFQCPFCDNGCRTCQYTGFVTGWTLIDQGWTIRRIYTGKYARKRKINQILELCGVNRDDLLGFDTINRIVCTRRTL
jgi:hypothetical protein